MSHIRTQAHELEGNLHFAPTGDDEYDGLAPYRLSSQFFYTRYDEYGDTVGTDVDGELWTVEPSYRGTGIAARPSDDLSGELLGFVLKGRGPGEKKATFQIEPRFEHMVSHDTREELPIPWNAPGGVDGINVKFQGSNVEPDEYPRLLRAFVDAIATELGTTARTAYFRDPLPSSNIYAYERYARPVIGMGKKLVRKSGAFHRLFMLLSTQDGARGQYTWDNEEVLGHLHTFKLHPESASELAPDHTLGKQLKHYRLRNPDAGDEATIHPKFGVLVNQKLNDGEAIPWDERHDVRREIEETIINVLDWAGIPIQPDPTTYVADDHFSVEASELDIERFADPTPELEAQQDALLMRTLRDLSPSGKDVLEELATDGGQHYRDLADETDTSISTIYRALDELRDLVRNDDGHVGIVSEQLRQEIEAIVEQTEGQLASAADRAAKLVNLGTRQVADAGLRQWLDKYGVELVQATDDDDRARLRFDTVLSRLKGREEPHPRDVLQEGLDAWQRAGRSVDRFRDAIIEATIDGTPVEGPARVLA